MGLMSIDVMQWHWSLGGLSRALLYLLGLGAETIILSAIYYFIPVGCSTAAGGYQWLVLACS